MGDTPRYLEIDPPSEKPPTEYTYVERRAEIAKAIRQQGHPTGFNYAEIGRKYDVSREQIRRDFGRLSDYFADRIGDGAQEFSDLAYRKIAREHMANGDLEKARRALDSWNSWMFDSGVQEKEPDKQELTGGGGGPVEFAKLSPEEKHALDRDSTDDNDGREE